MAAELENSINELTGIARELFVISGSDYISDDRDRFMLLNLSGHLDNVIARLEKITGEDK